MIQFIWPWVATILPLPLLIRFIVPEKNSLKDAALRIPFMDDFHATVTSDKVTKKNIPIMLLAIIAWCLLILAATRPQWLGEPVELPISGRDLMMAVDLSGSMQVEDFKINNRTVNRLQATKHVATQFIKSRQGDRIGLILFGRQAYLQTPLTFDRNTVNILLNEAAIGLAGQETAIGDAIGLAIKRLVDLDNKNLSSDESQEAQSRVLILLTDGANTAGEITPIKAAELAAINNLKIYTIGIGADEMIRHTFFGSQRVNPSADLDEKTLTAIAEKTGGRYFRARDTEELKNIYSLLNELEPTEKDSQSFRPITALFHWPLTAALTIVFIISLFETYPFICRLLTQGNLFSKKQHRSQP
ncbi:MAG: VWA domain-containing protein [Woeseiaceae bacterium]